MSIPTSAQIISKSNLIKAVLNDILLDIGENSQLNFTQQTIADLQRAMTSCEQLIDLGAYLQEKTKEYLR